MEHVKNTETTSSVISSAALLAHWQGHRALTRRVIVAFPDEEFFDYTIGGMRPAAALVQELLAIAAPGIREIALGKREELNEHFDFGRSKAKVLAMWDDATEQINKYWAMIPDGKFNEMILAFGQYEGTVCSTIFYFIDNEIHHRGQAYVYLRSLGVTPPAFYER